MFSNILLSQQSWSLSIRLARCVLLLEYSMLDSFNGHNTRQSLLVAFFLFVQTATQQLAVFLNVDTCTLTVSVFHRPLHIGIFELHFSYSEWICNKDERYVCVFVFCV